MSFFYKIHYICIVNFKINTHAFWDIDINQLDQQQHADFIIARVFQYGLEEDLRNIIKHYTKNEINHALTHTRGIDNKALDLAKVLGYL